VNLQPIEGAPMNLPGKRLLLGTAVAAAALGVGGFAYAAGNDPVPDHGYVTIENDATTPSPGTNGHDCPEKNNNQQSQPSTPEQSQSDVQGQA
jgi:hypothetical protein